MSEQLAAVTEHPADPEVVTSAYEAVQGLITKAVEADPELHAYDVIIIDGPPSSG